MVLAELLYELENASGHSLSIHLGQHRALPPHFHITEVGVATKEFVDCGGQRRQDRSCILQTLTATDYEHRLTTDKLLGIFRKTAALNFDPGLPIDLEIQGATIELWRLTAVTRSAGQLTLQLAERQTACLAQDQCGISGLPVVATSRSGDAARCC